jgi:hypothetical protein
MMFDRDRFVWEIKKGDLVKLKMHYGSRDNEYIYRKGVVISEIKHRDDQQIPMWPAVDVYIFQTGTIKECLPGSVEVISVS